MSDSNKLPQQIAAGLNADLRVNENFAACSPAMLYAMDARTTTGLTWGYYGGRYSSTAIANGTLPLTASSTNYIVAERASGAVTVSATTGDWNNDADFVKLYKLVVGASTVTSYEDHRQAILAAGSSGGGGSGGGGPMSVMFKTSSYTLQLSDAEDAIVMNSTLANTVTVPANATVAFAVGTSILIAQKGAGTTSIAAGSGVTVRKRAAFALDLAGQYAQVALLKVDTDEWYLTGDLA